MLIGCDFSVNDINSEIVAVVSLSGNLSMPAIEIAHEHGWKCL